MDENQNTPEKDPGSKSGMYNDVTWDMSNPTEVKCYRLECNLAIQRKVNAILAIVSGAASAGLIAWLTT